MTVTSQQARIVLSTADSDEEANHIAYALVDKRLAACISLIPNVKSIYRWQGSSKALRRFCSSSKPLWINSTNSKPPCIAFILTQFRSFLFLE